MILFICFPKLGRVIGSRDYNDPMEVWPVRKAVGNVWNKGPELIEKIEARNVIRGIQAMLAAVAFAFSLRMTGSLWLAIGSHSGWDYAESFIFGVPNSALVFADRALHPLIHGPVWIT